MQSTHYLKRYITKELRGARKSRYHEITENEYEYWNGIRVLFKNVNYRYPNIMTMRISVPQELLRLPQFDRQESVFFEDWIYRSISSVLNEYAELLKNEYRESSVRGGLHLQTFDNRIVRRTGMRYEAGFFCVKIFCILPLMGTEYIETKKCIRLIGDILLRVTAWAEQFEAKEMSADLETYRRQQSIRKYISEHGYCCFVGNGSIITRNANGTGPLESAIPFQSPKEDEINVEFSDGTFLRGMAIRNNSITVITGGGYSGKTTLLDGIESGIYNHVRGDGREYIITDQTAIKTFAEDGRPVNNLNLSPFFSSDFLNQSVYDFSTDYASGSVSQAANVIEALYAGSHLLLVDEDKSATNFLVKDAVMRKINPKDSIVPFTDRIREIVGTQNTAVILVVGAVSAYFEYADVILLAEQFVFRDLTGVVSQKAYEERMDKSTWTKKRYCCRNGEWEDSMFRTVTTENSRMICIGKYSVDTLALSAIVSNDQLNSLAYALELILSKRNCFEIGEAALETVNEVLEEDLRPAMTFERLTSQKNRWYEEVRVSDIICCLCRIRGLHMKDGAVPTLNMEDQ